MASTFFCPCGWKLTMTSQERKAQGTPDPFWPTVQAHQAQPHAQR